MQFFKDVTKIDFMRLSKPAMMISGLVILIAIGSLFVRGLNMGIDFTGGTLLEVGYEKPVELNGIRSALASNGFTDAVVQHFGTSKDVLVRIAPREKLSSAELSNTLLEILRKNSDMKVELRRIEFVGPQVGDELFEKGGLALLTALGCIFIYVWVRYEKRFSVGAVAALIHDTIITIGAFSLFQLEFNLTVLAAILAVIGYSLNDTIVVYDRIRDNFRRMRKATPAEVMNLSINQTLSRTTMTSFFTLLAVIALYLFGGELIHGFSAALIIGIVVGTYSSIYIASAAALLLGISRQDLLPPEKEGADQQPIL